MHEFIETSRTFCGVKLGRDILFAFQIVNETPQICPVFGEVSWAVFRSAVFVVHGRWTDRQKCRPGCLISDVPICVLIEILLHY